MEIIASQDFNNKLAHTGIAGPDKIVDLFNTMIDKLRSERTRNLEQDNFLQLLIKASPMGVLILDFDKVVSMVNPSLLKMTAINKENELVGKKLQDVNVALIREMCKVKQGKNAVIRIGDVMMYRCYHLSFVQSGFRREFYLLESLTDEVSKAERAAYEKVIRTISHEVNNTMGGVRTAVQTIAQISDDKETIDVLESCDNRCRQMCAFVSSYADVVRLPEPMKQPLDLNEEVMKIMPFLGMMTDISLEFVADPNPVVAFVDSNMIQQAIVNIVKNAGESFSADVHNDKNWIRITVRHEKGYPYLEIANNGEPLSDDAMQNLFRPFYSTKRGGRGIGLTLTSEILNRHSARFSLLTDPDGITRFRVFFECIS